MEKRTDYCGNITSKYLGQEVLLYGWVQRVRNLGQLIFIDHRDFLTRLLISDRLDL